MVFDSTQKDILAKLADALQSNESKEIEPILWEALLLFEGYPFETVKGLQFSYRIKGYELFVDRKEKSITRSTINMSLEKVIKLEYNITGPKKIGTFGASYIYPIFKTFGIIK